MHYETVGSGEPLILLLPQSLGPAGRKPLFDKLALQRTVILCEWGQADSSTSIGFTMEAAADDVATLLGSLGIPQAECVCHSTGCGIGLSLAARYPESVSKLVLAAPWTHGDSHLSNLQTLRKSAAFLLNAEQYFIFNSVLLFPAEFRRAHEKAFEEMARKSALSPHDPESITHRLDAILDFDARSLFRCIQCPTLILVAKDDQVMPYWFAIEAADQITDSKYIEFDTGGHMLLDTRTEDFCIQVFEFLTAARRTE